MAVTVLVWQNCWLYMPAKADSEPLLEVCRTWEVACRGHCGSRGRAVAAGCPASVWREGARPWLAVLAVSLPQRQGQACASWAGAGMLPLYCTSKAACRSHLLRPDMAVHTPAPFVGPGTHADHARCAQVWLQDLAWSEADKEERLRRRADNAVGPHERHVLESEPMFCMETAIALHRWSQLAYLGARALLPTSWRACAAGCTAGQHVLASLCSHVHSGAASVRGWRGLGPASAACGHA